MDPWQKSVCIIRRKIMRYFCILHKVVKQAIVLNVARKQEAQNIKKVSYFYVLPPNHHFKKLIG